MDGPTSMGTSHETAVAQRQQMVRWHQHGWRYATIAAHLGCSRWTVGRWVRAHAWGGEAALVSPGHRPHTPHPQLTAPAVQARIRTIRHTHPGWGARLIRRQLDLDGVTAPPSEGTIHHWLRRQGFPLVRPRARNRSAGRRCRLPPPRRSGRSTSPKKGSLVLACGQRTARRRLSRQRAGRG